MSITLNQFSSALYEFHLKHADGIDSLQKLIEKSKKYFIDNLKLIDDTEFVAASIPGSSGSERKAHLIKWCRDIINKSRHAIKRYDESMGAEGFKDFYDIFFPSDRASSAANIKDVHPRSFYRMRKAEQYQLYDRKGLFVISQKLDNLVAKQRFNNEGKPCLYLASNLYIAWEECRRPDFNLVNFSRFYNEKTLKVMSITIAPKMKTMGDFIMGYFTLLCSMKTHDEDSFKFQYTVSNLFMKVLFTNIRNGGDVDGIKYLSSRRFDCTDFLLDPNDIDDVYVFPPKENPVNGICPKLKKMFKMTKPRTHFLYKAYRFSFDTTYPKTSKYQDSLFAEIEKQLETEDLAYFDN